jgi:tetratricopeptide (TPR) repeat protein
MVMRRIALAGLALIVTVPVAGANPAADCSQHQDADRRIRGCSELIRQNPRHPDLFKMYHNRALAYWKKGQYDPAIQDYNKAIELNSRIHGLFYDRATLFLIKKQNDRAIADYDKAVALDPRHANSYFNRGAAYADKGQHERAIRDYNKAIEINPRDAKTFYNRGNSHVKNKQLDKAIPDYTKAIELDPKLARAYSDRGIVYEALGRKTEAIADLRKSLALDPRIKLSQDALARLEAAIPSDPAVAEFCGKAKEPKKCLSTQALVQQLKKDPKAARWNDEVDFTYTRSDDESSMLFKFMLESMPSQGQQPKR